MADLPKMVRVWFEGGAKSVAIKADDVFVGSIGELKLSNGGKFTTIIAPGKWVFVDME